MRQIRDSEIKNEDLVKLSVEADGFKSPAFQFYPGDWLGSVKIMLMKPPAVGGYIMLMSVAWNSEDCGLPIDDIALSTLSRLGTDWPKYKDEIMACFFPHAGRLYNRRLLIERRKQLLRREQASKAGKISAETRATTKTEKKLPVAKPAKKEEEDKMEKAFMSVWNIYPKKVGKKESYRHFRATVKSKEDYHAIQKALDNYMASDRVARGFIMDGSTWFNNWKDFVEFAEVNQDEAQAIARRKKEADREERLKQEQAKANEIITQKCNRCKEPFKSRRSDNADLCTTCRPIVIKEVREAANKLLRGSGVGEPKSIGEVMNTPPSFNRDGEEVKNG